MGQPQCSHPYMWKRKENDFFLIVKKIGSYYFVCELPAQSYERRYSYATLLTSQGK